MSDTAREAVREAAGNHIHRARPEWHDNGVGIVQGSHYRAGFIDGAEWQASQQPAPEDVRDELAKVVDVALDEWACRGTNGLGTPSYRITDAILAVFDVRRKP